MFASIYSEFLFTKEVLHSEPTGLESGNRDNVDQNKTVSKSWDINIV